MTGGENLIAIHLGHSADLGHYNIFGPVQSLMSVLLAYKPNYSAT